MSVAHGKCQDPQGQIQSRFDRREESREKAEAGGRRERRTGKGNQD